MPKRQLMGLSQRRSKAFKKRFFECLEERQVMAVAAPAADSFAVFYGELTPQSPTQSFDFTISTKNFELVRRSVSLNLHLVAEDPTLQPSVATITNLATGSRVAAPSGLPNQARGSESLIGVNLTPGSYRVTASGQNGSLGAFRLEADLEGDLDGDRWVSASDCNSIKSRMMSTAGSPSYVVEADTNLDGRIDGSDYARCSANQGARTNITPLALDISSINPSVASDHPDTALTNSTSLTISGQVNAPAQLRLETNGDEKFNDGSFQLPAGSFSVPISQPLMEGMNLVQIQVKDEFGQQRTVSRRVVRDTTSPTLSAGLANDSAAGGATNSDRITNDATISGQATDASGIVGLFARFASAVDSDWVNITTARQNDGSFTLSTATLASILGAPLTDGSYVLNLRAIDRAGNSRQTSLDFVLDRVVDGLDVALAAASDTGVVGDSITTERWVTLRGTTEAGSLLNLQSGEAAGSTTSDGAFSLSNVPLAMGLNSLIVVATDVAGNQTQATVQLRCDEVVTTSGWMLKWGWETLEAIKAGRTPPPRASRFMAMQQLAIYDTVRAIAGQSGYLTSLVAPASVSTDVAISQASRDILVAAFPSSATRLNALLDQVLITVADGAAKSDSIMFGSSVAAAILAARSTDGSSTVVTYTPQSGPGYWQPTLPAYAAALLPNWANLVPFAMTSSSQFQPAGPPSLSSAEYAAAFTETYQLGSLNSSSRTADQTEIALFWADGAGTYTPPGHWQQIAMRLLAERGASPDFFAATMAKLTVALADAAVVSWNAKYRYEFWRPITAIAAADTDGNSATTADSTWRPLIATPPFPEYTSGHSTFSGAAAEILSVLLGRDSAFTTTSDGLPGVTRSFTSFEQAANEAGRSRIYGGIHFDFSNRDGLDSGRQLASHVLQRFASLEGNTANAAGATGSPTGLSGSEASGSQALLSAGGLLLGSASGTASSTSRTTSLATAATSTEINNFAANPFANSFANPFAYPSTALVSPTDDYFAQLTADNNDDEADEEAVWSALSLLD